MTAFALYRFPYEQQCTLVTGEVSEIPSSDGLSASSGFVVAPFAQSPQCPILLISPDRVDCNPTSYPELPTLSQLPLAIPDTYHADFSAFHDRLISGDFQKLVLSRCLDIRRENGGDPFVLFRKACENYPRMFISLVFTPLSGLWLTATPEVLLAGNDSAWQTMALAGTMPFADEVGWSDKNIQEQRYVATYVTEQLEHFANDISEQGPRTVRAGHLAHLRSDFLFTLKDDNHLGELIEALHPTPAVCGLPKEEAFRFILDTEHHDRRYYSGFMGPLHTSPSTRLFVTLRCMQIFRDGYRLYAGGGLLKDSVEEQEWQETETKLDTMRNIIRNV